MTRLGAALAMSLVLGCTEHRREADPGFHPLDSGVVAPAYTTQTLDGAPVTIGANQPVTLLNVWATWCTSCREEMAMLDSLHAEFAPRGLRVVGVSVDQSAPARVRNFTKSEALHFLIAHDPAGDIQRDYQLVGVPTTFLIGRDGKLLWRHTGNISEVRTPLRAALASALGG